MKSVQSTLGVLLTGLAKTITSLTDKELEKLINGDLRPTISFEQMQGSKETGKLLSSSVNFDDFLERLQSTSTREDGVRLVESTFSDKMTLVEFAKFLDLPVQKKDKTDRVREKIVEATVGARLGSEAIRGGY